MLEIRIKHEKRNGISFPYNCTKIMPEAKYFIDATVCFIVCFPITAVFLLIKEDTI
jgi:hypothetical protein